jgi:signal transduction histidine kinase
MHTMVTETKPTCRGIDSRTAIARHGPSARKRISALSAVVLSFFLAQGAPSRLAPGEIFGRVDRGAMHNTHGVSLPNRSVVGGQANFLLTLCLFAAGAGLLPLLSLHRTFSQKIRTGIRRQERQRIARELHDTLIQSVQGLILSFQAIAADVPDSGHTRQRMERELDRAEQLLGEARDRVSELRVIHGDYDLIHALSRLTSEMSVDGAASSTITISGTAYALTRAVTNEAYLIVREALSNAHVHARAHHIELKIAFTSTQFMVRIRDDGIGIADNILRMGGCPQHFGLEGMRERAEAIGARLHIRSSDDGGTEIELAIDAGVAYSRSVVGWTQTLWSRISSRALSPEFLTAIEDDPSSRGRSPRIPLYDRAV